MFMADYDALSSKTDKEGKNNQPHITHIIIALNLDYVFSSLKYRQTGGANLTCVLLQSNCKRTYILVGINNSCV